MKIAVIGSGAYGLAMTKVLSKNPNNKITIWTESKENVNLLREKEFLAKFIPGFEMPESVEITASYETVMKGADLILIMVAAKFVDDVAINIRDYLKRTQYIVVCSKGIEQDTCMFVHEVIEQYINTKRLGVISGPSFAIDMANEEPVGLSMASSSRKLREMLEIAFKDSTVKLRRSTDMLGVEVCGSVKNVIAIAAGMIAGMGYSVSTQAFLITESLHDIKFLIRDLGGKHRTVLSFAGIGDLLLTCTSTKSRNFSFGHLIGSGASAEEINDYIKNTTVEGYYTIKSIRSLVRKKQIKMPIIDLIYKIIVDHDDPELLIKYLMTKK